MNIINEYETKDLYEAAFLIASGVSLLNTYKQLNNSTQIIIFVFADKDICFELVKAYLNFQGTVSPKIYADVIRSLKDIIHANKR